MTDVQNAFLMGMFPGAILGSLFILLILLLNRGYKEAKAEDEKIANDRFEKMMSERERLKTPVKQKTLFEQMRDENPLLFEAIMANAMENGRRMEEEENKRN